MRLYVKSGVKLNDEDEFEFDYSKNDIDDIVLFDMHQIHESSIRSKVYWFGYKFNDDVPSKTRKRFIEFLKGIGPQKISQQELYKFVERPIAELEQRIDIYDIDCFVYPVSGRSNLVNEMIKVIGDSTSRDMNRVNFELIKSVPSEVEFDRDLYEQDHGYKPNYEEMVKNIEENVLPQIHVLDYFSIGSSVKYKYRRYLTNFLKFKTEEQKRTFEKLQGDNILLVDDINTSGSTLNEILRIIGTINNNCTIYVYTLIGK